jgi:hypothetical protein
MMARRKNVSKKEKNTYKIGKAMILTISGAVGIGVQTPSMRLNVVGNNIGVGVQTPSMQLDVGGNNIVRFIKGISDGFSSTLCVA